MLRPMRPEGKRRPLHTDSTGTAEHWSGLMAWIRERLQGQGFIAPDDIRLVRCTDDIDEAVELIQQCHLRQLAL